MSPSNMVANTVDVLIKPEKKEEPLPEVATLAIKQTHSIDFEKPPEPNRQ